MQIFSLENTILCVFSSFCQLHRASRSHFCGRCRLSSSFSRNFMRVFLRPFSPAFHAGYRVRSIQANCIRRSFVARGVGGLPRRCPPSACGRFLSRCARTIISTLASVIPASFAAPYPSLRRAAEDAAPPARSQCGCSPCGEYRFFFSADFFSKIILLI